MQGGKETTSNVAASAKSGLEKAKATAQEKVLSFFDFKKKTPIFLVIFWKLQKSHSWLICQIFYSK